MVNATGVALSEIEREIAEVTGAVAAIAEASREQTNSISEMSSAISDMDSMTQKNAAMVEDTSQSTVRLRQQAELLEGYVRFFETDIEPCENRTEPSSQMLRVANG